MTGAAERILRATRRTGRDAGMSAATNGQPAACDRNRAR
jgi:hypothetical protein